MLFRIATPDSFEWDPGSYRLSPGISHFRSDRTGYEGTDIFNRASQPNQGVPEHAGHTYAREGTYRVTVACRIDLHKPAHSESSWVECLGGSAAMRCYLAGDSVWQKWAAG